jgi:hypothetical protein
VALAGIAAAACGDDPFAVRWAAQPDTVLLFSLARPELNLLSAFDFRNRARLRVEQPGATGRWDAALDTRDGQLVFLPPRVLGVESRAGIVPIDSLTFDEVVAAPADTAVYRTDVAVPIALGVTYVVRTHQTTAGFFGTLCVYYAKLEPLEVDVAAGTLRFVFDGARVCNDRGLVPTA